MRAQDCKPHRGSLLLRARAVAPISRPPVHNGAVWIRGCRIRAVGSWNHVSRDAPASARVFDLGNCTIMPGLVNSHAHLDYTDMAGQFLPPCSFTDWIKLITEAKSSWTQNDFRTSWLKGARMLLESGATTVADIEAIPDLLPEVWHSTPLRIVSFVEMTGVRSRLDPETMVANTVARAMALLDGRNGIGLSPHAPYSTTPALLRLSAEAARSRGWLLATHVAESVEEHEMFRNTRGPMFDWLSRNGRDMSDCGGCSPVGILKRLGVLGPGLLAIHANCVDSADIGLLARHHASVVHCPRSHAYFRHPPFAYERMRRAGIRVCLGTDSLATVLKSRQQGFRLDLFEEMREFANAFQSAHPRQILRLATVHPAAALGFAGCVGRLENGCLADLVAVPFDGDGRRPEETILAHTGPVCASMIGGFWAIPPPR